LNKIFLKKGKKEKEKKIKTIHSPENSTPVGPAPTYN